MTPLEREGLRQAVQTNCHIADARHAADMTLCTYLLLMRELFRWEHGLPFATVPDRGHVGRWIAEREALWERIEAHPFEPLRIDHAGPVFDPFDVAAINDALAPHALVYGAGLVGAGRPVFFLADLARQARREELPTVTAGREWARGLLAPPAVLSPAPPTIVLRLDAIRRACWQRYESYALRPHDGSAMQRLAAHYDLVPDLEAGLARWTDDQAEIATLHELGEARVGARLEPGWSAMRLALTSRRAAVAVQALRDLLADLEVTLPVLLGGDVPIRLHGWFAQFDGLRKELFPALEDAYRRWRDGDAGSALRQAIAFGRERHEKLAWRVLELHARDGPAAAKAIEALLIPA
jgi:hypothetical protein